MTTYYGISFHCTFSKKKKNNLKPKNLFFDVHGNKCFI
jgi:hypothetical protein